MTSSMIGDWKYLLFLYLFGILMSILARIMFGSGLLSSLVAYLGLGRVTKGRHHMIA